LITEREVTLIIGLYMATILMFCVQEFTKQDLVRYISHHKSEVEERQVMDVHEAHRRRILALKSAHNDEMRQLHGTISTSKAQFYRLNGEYNWMSDTYQEQIRMIHEQEDRIAYLEGKLHEFGQTTPTTRQPFSAPPSQIKFNKPPRRSRHDSTTGAPSPLAHVSFPPDSYSEIPTDFTQVMEAEETEGQ
jgi:hypothetical protein